MRNIFYKDAEGAGKWALDVMKRYGYKSDFYDPAIYWAARCAAHWAHKAIEYETRIATQI